jgi:ketosteroid isomerase-like protein
MLIALALLGALTDAPYDGLSRAYAKLDASLAANQYAEDALYSEPGSDFIRGRAAIRAVFDRIFKRARDEHRDLEITFEFTERQIVGDFAYDAGVYRLGSGRGKFVTVLRRGPDGRWRFAVDAWNSAPRQP